MATQTGAKASTKASDFFEAAQIMAINLYGRWQDEHDYEKIEDYALPLTPIANDHGVKIIKMTKRPFGCHFSVDGKTFQLKVTARAYEYKRIA